MKPIAEYGRQAAKKSSRRGRPQIIDFGRAPPWGGPDALPSSRTWLSGSSRLVIPVFTMPGPKACRDVRRERVAAVPGSDHEVAGCKRE
jgi:hypothetical protein